MGGRQQDAASGFEIAHGHDDALPLARRTNRLTDGRRQHAGRLEQGDVGPADGFQQQADGRASDVPERVRNPSAPGEYRQRSARRSHPQAQRPLEMIAVELPHAEGNAAQFLDEGQFSGVLHLRFLQEHALHFDIPLAGQQRQDEVQQAPARAAGTEYHGNPPWIPVRWVRRHFLLPLHLPRHPAGHVH